MMEFTCAYSYVVPGFCSHDTAHQHTRAMWNGHFAWRTHSPVRWMRQPVEAIDSSTWRSETFRHSQLFSLRERKAAWNTLAIVCYTAVLINKNNHWVLTENSKYFNKCYLNFVRLFKSKFTKRKHEFLSLLGQRILNPFVFRSFR